MDKITSLLNRATQLRNEYDLKHYELLEAEIELSKAEDEEIEAINTFHFVSKEEQEKLNEIYKLNDLREKLKIDSSKSSVEKEQSIYALTVLIKELIGEL